MGWRNRAVTANQSASPPTMPASAAARTYPQTQEEPGCFSKYQLITNRMAAPTSRPNGHIFIRRRERRRSASVIVAVIATPARYPRCGPARRGEA